MEHTSNKSHTPIIKNLEEEDKVTDHVAYFLMAGANTTSAYRSPEAYVLLFFEMAIGVHSIDFTEYKEGNCQIHISFPEQVHSWDTKDCYGHKLILSKYLVEKYLFKTGFPGFIMNRHPILKPGKDHFNMMLEEVRRIATGLSKPDVGWYEIVLRMRIVATLIGRSLEKEMLDYRPTNNYAKHFLKLLQDDFSKNRSVDFYARKLSISTSYLNAICKKEFSINVKSIIDWKIVQEAKHLLLEENISIKEISNALGFQSMSQFSRFLKSRVGFGPQEFRKTFYDIF